MMNPNGALLVSLSVRFGLVSIQNDILAVLIHKIAGLIYKQSPGFIHDIFIDAVINP